MTVRTPIKPLPEAVARWTARARWLRWLDALGAWLVLWASVVMLFRGLDSMIQVVMAAVLVAVGASLSPLRLRWRPISGWVGVVVSRPLRPGDRAWYVRPGEARLGVVTARRGLRVVIAQAQSPAEGIVIRRTRALLLPADSL